MALPTCFTLRSVRALVVLGLVGCGETPPATQEASADIGAETTPDSDATPAPDASAGADAAADAAASCAAGASCACEADAECGSGRCVETASGKRCALPCGDGCPAGSSCSTAGGVSWCAPIGVRQCAPCLSDKQCSGEGGAAAMCVSTGIGGSFCAAYCKSDSDCPSGNICRIFAASDLQAVCAPKEGIEACSCSAWATTAGATTNCTAFVGTTACTGTRSCGADGLGACQAAPGLPCKEVNCASAADGSPCDDGDGCTSAVCNTGQCVAAANLCECQSDSDCPDDGDLCNGTPVCDKSQVLTKCLPNATPPVVCEAATAQCQVRACEPSSGKCLDKAAADGTACEDEKPCTDNSCAGGKCQATEQQKCVCDSDAFCAFKDDGNLCNGVWFCDKAQVPPVCSPKPDSSVSCDDGNLCTNDVCDPASGACQFVPNAVPCDDGSLCTKNDVCANGSCGGEAVDCEDGWKDSTDACDPPTGCTQIWNEICDGIDNDGDGSTDNVVCGSGPCTCAPNGTATCPADCVTCPDSGDLAIPIANGSQQPVMNAVVCAHDYPAWGIKPDDPGTLIDNGDETLTDTFTGLQWTKQPFGTAKLWAAQTWPVAVLRCDESTAGGYDDWRLPTFAEMESLTNPAGAATQPFVTGLTVKYEDAYWTATLGITGWSHLGFAGETGRGAPYGGDALHAFCVRASEVGSTTPSEGRWKTQSGGLTVFDQKTLRMWQRNYPPQNFAPVDAQDYCEELNYAGLSDWHLPSTREQRSLIVRNSGGDEWWDSVAFGPVTKTESGATFWSATPGYKSGKYDTYWTVEYWNLWVSGTTLSGNVLRKARCVRNVGGP